MLVATIGASQGPAPAWAEEATKGNTAGILVPAPAPDEGDLIPRASAVRERFVALDLALLERALVAGSADRDAKVRFELFPDAVVELATESFDRRADGFAWSGTSTGADGSDQEATVVFQQPSPETAAGGAVPAVVGNFWAGTSQYRLQAANRTGTVYSVVELDQAKVAETEGDPHGHDHGTAEEPSDTGDQPDGPPSVPLPFGAGTVQGTAEAAADGGISVIDVLVVYTPAALAARPDVQAEVAAQLEAGNRANDTSGVRFHFRVPHFMQAQYTERTNDMVADLRDLEAGRIPGVHQARNAYAADLVMMAGAGYTDYCGVASTIGASAASAFAVVNADPNCVLTAVHEMGHLLGLRHDWRVDSTAGYNHGFVNTVARFRTIMAYPHPDCGPAGCMRIEHWSDPDRTWNGQQTGVPDGLPNPSDNGRALAEGFGPAVNFRIPQAAPIGNYDILWQWTGGLRVAGWALDQDTPAPIDVHIYIDGNGVATTAGDYRSDVGAHGFDRVYDADDGTHEVCVYAINDTGQQPHTFLGCRTVTIAVSPFGALEAAYRQPSGIWLGGWAIDPDLPTTPLTVEVRANGKLLGTTTAEQRRDDVGSSHPSAGPNHGYSVNVAPQDIGTYPVCAIAKNVSAGHDTTLGCRTLTVLFDPIGSFEALWRAPTGGRALGWALDPDSALPVAVTFTVDGVPTDAQPANGTRTDVGDAYPGYGNDHGFNVVVPMTSGVTHTVCAVVANQAGTMGANSTIGCRTITPDTDPFGGFEGASRENDTTAWVGGWAIDPDVGTPIVVQATVDGMPAGEIVANQTRNDVGAAYSEYGTNHGFSHNLVVTPGPHTVCITALNVGPGANTDFGCRNM